MRKVFLAAFTLATIMPTWAQHLQQPMHKP